MTGHKNLILHGHQWQVRALSALCRYVLYMYMYMQIDCGRSSCLLIAPSVDLVMQVSYQLIYTIFAPPMGAR